MMKNLGRGLCLLCLLLFSRAEAQTDSTTLVLTDSLAALAGSYKIAGDFENAEIYINRAEEIAKNQFPIGMDKLGSYRRQKTIMYLDFGKFQACEKYIDSLLEFYSSKALAQNWYGVFLVYKAEIQYFTRKYELGLDYFRAATIISKKMQDSGNLGSAYSGMGNIFFGMKMFDSCLVYEHKALNLTDTSSSLYHKSLSNLALIYSRIGRCEQSRSFMNKSKEAYQRSNPISSDNALFYGQLSRISYRCQFYREAIQYAKTANEAFKDSDLDFFWINRFFRYAINSYIKLGEIDSARMLCKVWIPMKRSEVVKESAYLSSDEKVQYLGRKVKRLYETLSILEQQDSGNMEFAKQAFEYMLFLKRYPLEDLRQLKEKVSSSNDSSLQYQFERWTQLRDEYYGTIRFESGKDTLHLDSVKKELWTREQFLYEKLKVGDRRVDYENNTFNTIRKNLDEDDLSVEFVRYYSTSYAEFLFGAFISHSKSESPAFIHICAENHLINLLERKPKETEFKYITRLYQDTTLYHLLWSDILKQYPDKSKFFASYSGVLNAINHEALKIDNRTTLIDKIKIVSLNSTAELVDRSDLSFDPQKTNVTLFGGIRYDAPINGTDSLLGQNNVYTKYRGKVHGSWNYLEHTKYEIDGLQKIISNSGGQVVSFNGIDASEPQFKKIDGSSSTDIIHIATHGFYLKDTSTLSSTLQTSTYTRSGLVMAGANACRKQQLPISAFGDGIITAPEIALMNLKGTRLVVLSACESGLGVYSYFGNSYNLQKAFKTAGVDYVIYSLWKVSDKITKEFMLDFYTRLMKGIEIQKAFSQTQTAMKDKYKTYYWASFQLLH